MTLGQQPDLPCGARQLKLFLLEVKYLCAPTSMKLTTDHHNCNAVFLVHASFQCARLFIRAT